MMCLPQLRSALGDETSLTIFLLDSQHGPQPDEVRLQISDHGTEPLRQITTLPIANLSLATCQGLLKICQSVATNDRGLITRVRKSN